MAKDKNKVVVEEAANPQEAAANEEPVKAEAETEAKPPTGKWAWLYRIKNWYLGHKKLAIPLTVVALILLMLAIPWTRYNSLGLVLKKGYSIQVIDSTTKSPVSGALVTYGSISASTDGDGIAKLKSIKVGPHPFLVTKKYYKDGSVSAVVPILSQKNIPHLELTATGRQVKVNIVNTINKKSVGEVNIKVADISAKTDSSGNAALVLPPGVAEQKAELSLDGYVTVSVVIKVSETKVEENKFSLTPGGKIYFLSKRTGKIDVMKSNLDGTDQTVVLAGTGKEDESDTILLASRDWKYLALKAKRDGDKAKLYWIDTSTDKLNTLDEGDASFTVIGWSDNTFLYTVSRNSVADWQPNKVALKSFDARSAKLTILNQTGGVGNSSNNYRRENISDEYIIDDKVVFVKEWDGCCYSPDIGLLADKKAGIYSINVNGSGFNTLKTFDYTDNNRYIYINSVLYAPKEIYYVVYSSSGVDESRYFEYESGAVKEDASLKEKYEKFVSTTYPNFLLSPSGKQAYWTQSRDGKLSFLVGDGDAKNEKEVAKLEEKFLNYGYYTDEYLLLSKNSSELYVMSASGVKNESELIKITDYHKPTYSYHGYGGH